MSNTQLYFAIGLPCFTIVTSLAASLIGVFAIRCDISRIRQDLKQVGRKNGQLERAGEE